MIVLINPFEVPPATTDEQFLAGWQRAADHLRSQRGFLGTWLHRAISPDPRFRFINVAHWESPEAFRAAVGTDEFRRSAGGAPPGNAALYEVVRTIGRVDAQPRVEEGVGR